MLEDAVEPTELFSLFLGEAEAPRPVRIVWTQDESDGQIVGVQFLDTDGSLPDPPSAPTNAAVKRG